MRTSASPSVGSPPRRPLPPDLVSHLTSIVGAAAVITDPARLLVYESDGLVHHRGAPAAVVLPADTGQAAAVVARLSAAGVDVVPRGAGTGLSGGAVPSPDAVVVGTARMNRILDLDPRRRRALLQAGVVNADLTRAARPHGLHYAPDPSSQTACTIGGNVAENSGGPHCLKYGVTARYVAGLTVVTPEGRVLRLDADRESHAGLLAAFIGSEGCFGLVTEVEVELVPLPGGVRTFLAAFPTLEAAGGAVSALIARGALPAALEILDRHAIQAVEESVFAAGYPRDAGAVLVAEFDGCPGELEGGAAVAREVFGRHGVQDLREASDPVERAALWKGRKKAFGAMGRLGPDLMVQDATVPRSALPRVLAAIEEVARRHHLRVANVFHAGDGNLHPNLVFDRRDPGQVARVERASREIMRLCVDAGGTITGEHGVGVDKRGYMHLVHSPAELRLQRAVRRVFDPRGRWNPGKVLPDADCGADDGADPAPGAVREGGARGWGDADSTAGERRVPTVAGVVEYEPADLVVTAEAGMTVAALQARVAEAGQWVPVDAEGIDDLTLDEVVLGGAGNALTTRYGTLRDLLLGALVERPGAPTVQLGGRVVKNVAGFQLLPLLVGSRGRLGRLLRVTVRLWPAPSLDRTLVVAGDDLACLATLGDEVAALAPAPDAVELVWNGDGGGGELAIRAAGGRARVAATLSAAAALLRARGRSWREHDGRRSRIPALPRRRGWSRREGFTGRAREAVTSAGAGGGRLLVDRGLCFVRNGAAHARDDDPVVGRWNAGIRAAFAPGTTEGAGR